jgi:CHASE2 domain
MAAPVGFESQRRTKRRTQRDGHLRATIGLVVVALVASWMLVQLGLLGAADSGLRSLYYAIRGDRQDPHSVIFVAIDESTASAWGPPPWKWERYDEMVSAIDKGKPKVIAFLEPGPRLLPGPIPESLHSLRKRIESGHLIIPPVEAGYGQPRLAMESNTPVEAVLLGGERDISGPSVTLNVIRNANLDPTNRLTDGRLWTNFFGGPASLPTVPAHRIATHEIPASTFTDRIVIVGLRGERFAPIVPTPVGAMSPSEIHAHALLGLANGVAWPVLPGGAGTIWGVLLALVGALAVHRLRTGAAIALTAAFIVATVWLDYQLFSRGIARLGAGFPVAACLIACAGTWLNERSRAHRELGELTRWIAQRIAEQSRKRRGKTTDEDFWERFAEAARIYLEFDSTIFGELKPGAWHLHFRTFVGTAPDDILERRRDIRRDPYKRSYLSHKPMWTNRQFMEPAKRVQSLMVPLVAFNRAFGFWVINFPLGAEVGPTQMQFVEQLADQIALAIERRRLEDLVKGGLSQQSLPADGQLVAHVKDMREAALSLMQEQQGLSTLFDRLPVGVLVATLWGEIQFANESMKRFMRQFSTLVDREPQRLSLSPLLAELTGGSEIVVNEMLRELVAEGVPVRLSGQSKSTMGPAIDYEITISRLGGAERSEDDEGMRLLSDFVVTVTEREHRRADVTDWSMRLRGEDIPVGNLIDLRVLLRQTITELQAEGTRKQLRPVMLELPDDLPAIRLSDDFKAAFKNLLREATLATGDEPLRIVVTTERKEMVLHIIDSQSVLPRQELAVVEDTGGDHTADLDGFPEHIRALITAKRAIEGGNGRLSVSSDLASGTVVDIRLPRRRKPRGGPA